MTWKYLTICGIKCNFQGTQKDCGVKGTENFETVSSTKHFLPVEVFSLLPFQGLWVKISRYTS